MKAEIKQRWLEKLRSGQIPQARGVLRTEEGGMCCLGVLLDVISPNGWTGPIKDEDRPCRIHGHRMATGSHDFIEGIDRQRLGLTADVRNEEREYQTTVAHYLAFMNDEGKSFAQIADWIEANIPADAA
jgi:hypothetical protein